MKPFIRLPLHAVAAAVLVAACSPLPPAGLRVVPSPNFDERRANFVIIHQTTNDSIVPALRTLTDPERKVSAHYLIGRDGEILRLVDERMRAWHAGESWWGGNTDLNSSSIGIELDNNGDEPFDEPQMTALLGLLAELRERHRIPAANFIGHGDIAPRRKVDPSRHFPWRRMAEHGFGLWCDAPGIPAPSGFDGELGLQALGYDISDQAAAVLAFRRHFAGEEGSPLLSPTDLSLLHCLLVKKRATMGEAR